MNNQKTNFRDIKKTTQVKVGLQANVRAKNIKNDVLAKSGKAINIKDVYSAMIEVASQNESVVKSTIKSLIDSK